MRRSNAAAQKLSESMDEITPLEVLVLTMREIWGDGNIPLDRKKEACALAEKAAPYLHPRLASTQVTADITTDLRKASVEDLQRELQLLIGGMQIAQDIDGAGSTAH